MGNIFENLDEIADNFGEFLSPKSFSEMITVFLFIYTPLIITTFFGFNYFNQLTPLAGFSLCFIVIIDFFVLYCKFFRWVIYD